MTSLITSFTRRRFLAGAGAVSLLAARQGMSTSSAKKVTEYGDCTVLTALQWYQQFVLGNFMAIPNQGLGDGSAYDGWTIAEAVELGPIMVPSGWTVENYHANQFERDGTPVWVQEMLPERRWTATMITSPRQDAFYMHFTGWRDGPYLDSEGGAQLAQDLAIGTGLKTEPLCMLEQYTNDFDLPVTMWMSGDVFENYLVMSNGQSIGSDLGGMSVGPGSRFTMSAFVCDIDESEEYMLDVFVPHLWQLLPKGSGGGDDPIPTPTPTPW